ncbi:MAG: recombinase zinc beta ribbon domain-containing protein [Pseudomonadota bacterium]
MQARAKAGYWVFPAPAGYRFDQVNGHGKLIVRDEPKASIVTDLFEGLASGRFASITEAKRYIDTRADWPKPASGKIPIQSVLDIARRPIYAGLIDLPCWNLRLIPAQHEALVDYETWQRAQARLDGRTLAPVRQDAHRDFPLRGHVACHCCGTAMTAGWSKGRGKYYAYFTCQTKGCARKGKSIRKEKVESAFETLLRDLTPAPELIAVLKSMISDLQKSREETGKENLRIRKRDLAAIEAKIAKLVDRLLDTDSATLQAAFEKKLNEFEESRANLKAQLAGSDDLTARYSRISRTAIAFLTNPLKLWKSGAFAHQKTVARLAFSSLIPYHPETG